jgi:hypothetical protein
LLEVFCLQFSSLLSDKFRIIILIQAMTASFPDLTHSNCYYQACTNPGYQVAVLPKIFKTAPRIFYILIWSFCIFVYYYVLCNIFHIFAMQFDSIV